MILFFRNLSVPKITSYGRYYKTDKIFSWALGNLLSNGTRNNRHTAYRIQTNRINARTDQSSQIFDFSVSTEMPISVTTANQRHFLFTGKDGCGSGSNSIINMEFTDKSWALSVQKQHKVIELDGSSKGKGVFFIQFSVVLLTCISCAY